MTANTIHIHPHGWSVIGGESFGMWFANRFEHPVICVLCLYACVSLLLVEQM